MSQRPALGELTPDKKYYDNTMLEAYRTCPRKYFIRHVLHWRGEGTSAPLVFGLSWHAAQDVLWQGYGKMSDKQLVALAMEAFQQTWISEGFPEELTLDVIERLSPRTPMVAAEMLWGYLNARRHILEKMNLIACEQPFAVPLPLKETSPGSTWYAGRLDKVFQFNGAMIVGEHKTTTEYKIDGGFKDNYLQGWYIDSQVTGYLYGGNLFYDGVEQVWVDAALVHKKVHDKFKFIPVAHQWAMLEAWIEDTMEWVARTKEDEAKFRHEGKLRNGIFPKQTSSCMGKYGPCPYLDICRTIPDPSQLSEPPAGYAKEEWVPFDILKLDKLLQGDADGKQA